MVTPNDLIDDLFVPSLEDQLKWIAAMLPDLEAREVLARRHRTIRAATLKTQRARPYSDVADVVRFGTLFQCACGRPMPEKAPNTFYCERCGHGVVVQTNVKHEPDRYVKSEPSTLSAGETSGPGSYPPYR